MQNKPKRQHWVPRVYLRNFATEETRDQDNPSVWVFDKDEGNKFNPSIINILVEQYLYSPLDESGKRSFSVENELSNLETRIKPTLAKFCYEEIDMSNDGIRQEMSFFIATLIFRNKSMIDKHKGLHINIISDIEYSERAEYLDHESFVAFKQFKDNNPTKWDQFRFLDEKGFQKLFAENLISGASSIVPAIMEKKWGLIKSSDEVFVTSDDPLTAYHPKEILYGIVTKGVSITLPLCPNRLLWLHDLDEPDNKTYEVSNTGVESFNFFIMKFSKRFIIASKDCSEMCNKLLAKPI